MLAECGKNGAICIFGSFFMTEITSPSMIVMKVEKNQLSLILIVVVSV